MNKKEQSTEDIDVFQFNERINHLKNLNDGWFDGHGKKMEKRMIDWVENFVEFDELPYPLLFPMPEGGIELNWIGNGWDYSIHYYGTPVVEVLAFWTHDEQIRNYQLDIRTVGAYTKVADEIRELTRLTRKDFDSEA